LTVNLPNLAMSGDTFQCVVTNTVGSSTSSSAALVVTYPLKITTLAGLAGTSGSADGTGTAARFYYPADVTTDSAGNAYLSDADNHTIRKITSVGAVTTVAGQVRNAGSADGTGTSAQFNYPFGLAADSSGNLYVADAYNHAVRKITPAGVVTTVAGQARVPGTADGTGTAAQFYYPGDVAVDSSGNLYVADSYNHSIRKITPAGVVTTFAGLTGTSGTADGTGTAARFYYPAGVTVASTGFLYVADNGNNTIRRISAAGVVSTLAGLAGVAGGADGVGSAARLDSPSDLFVDGIGANIYVADAGNNAVRKVTATGIVSTVAGQSGSSGATDGTGTAARFDYPSGITVDSSGNVYVVDSDNHTLRLGVYAAAPVIFTQPQSQTVTAGSSVSFSVVVSGIPTPTYQWALNGAAISGATSDTLSLSNVQSSSAGNYTVTVSNTEGSVVSNAAVLTVNAVPPPSGGGGSSGGGGGGALPAWFVLALALLGAARRATMPNQTGRRGGADRLRSFH
jgi:sugar lactone lactonase YvrE